ncbi:CotH kinase family protein, partial [bacterium BMS3Abin03]|nr:CotH kinase family protein [bacterium BMS3Abin03]
MKSIILRIVPFLIIATTLFAQSKESWKLYDDTDVATVKINIDPVALGWLYNNVDSDSLFYAQFYFKNKYIEETVDSVGFRLRGNTSRYSQKKSFKVSFNDFIPGRNFYGVDKLNLNGEHNDPSIVRSKLCWDLFNTIGMKSSRAAYADVYINDQYYGLYISVEHIDDEFLQKNFTDDTGNLWKCLYPADLNYLGSDQNLYKISAYDLKTNEAGSDYSQLAHLIDILNNTPNNLFADSLESIIYIDELLKYFSMDILTGSWDDYWALMNNYYLYYEPAAKKFHLIPYDYDNTFGIDWSGNDWAIADPYNFPQVVAGYRPLAQRMMQNNQYRDLYTHFLEFYRENLFLLPLWENRIDSLRIMITPSALADNYRTLDYNFEFGDFLVSYTDLDYSN